MKYILVLCFLWSVAGYKHGRIYGMAEILIELKKALEGE